MAIIVTIAVVIG